MKSFFKLVRLIGKIIDVNVNGPVGQCEYCGTEGDVAFLMQDVAGLQDSCDRILIIDLGFDPYYNTIVGWNCDVIWVQYSLQDI